MNTAKVKTMLKVLLVLLVTKILTFFVTFSCFRTFLVHNLPSYILGTEIGYIFYNKMIY